MKEILSILVLGILLSGCQTTQSQKVGTKPVNDTKLVASATMLINPVEMRSRALFLVGPKYPVSILDKAIPFEAVLGFRLSPQGKIEDAVIIESTNEGYGEAALEALVKSKFRSAGDGASDEYSSATIHYSTTLGELDRSKVDPVVQDFLKDLKNLSRTKNDAPKPDA